MSSSQVAESNHGNTCQYKQAVDILRGLPFFAQMPLEALKGLAFLSKKVVYQPGEVIFAQGEMGRRGLYVLDGVAEIIRVDDSGEAVLGEVKPGEMIGSLALLAAARRLFTLKAKTAFTCLVVEREKFSAFIQSHPAAAASFFQAVATAVVEWEENYLLHDACALERDRDQVGVSLI